MASVILTNWTVYYYDDAPAGSSGYKQIKWTGSGAPETNTNTVNQLYSALADLFSIPGQNDAKDTTPMVAVTPTAYNIGAFDAGDTEPWFIDPDSIKHLTGGAIQTVNWTRVVNADTTKGIAGIVKVPYTVGGGVQFVASDIGRAIVNGTATGTLLWYDTANSVAWIRPTNCTSTHNWAGPAGAITVTGSTASVTQNGASVTGERLWSNLFTIGTLEANSVMFVYQNYTKITGFWSTGHLDRLFLTNDGFDAGLIDSGLFTVFARQYIKLYDNYTTDASGGGRNPVPITTITDTNNKSGYWQTVFSSSTGVWAKGQTFTKNGDSTREGTVTSATGANPDTIQYYLSGTSLTPFSNGDAVTSSAGGPATGNVQTPTAVGPASLAAITITFGATSEDIGDGEGSKPYDVSINVGGNTLANFYQYTKYITRRGNTVDIDDGGQTITGERYLTPGEIRLSYEGQTINYLEGATLTGQISGATCIITAVHDSGATGIVIVRDTHGTFQAGESILDNQGTPGNGTILASGGIETTAILKASPFGTLAGTNFFGAHGVWLVTGSMAGADANSYSLLDSNNDPRTPPATVPITVSGDLASGDRVFVYRTTGAGSSKTNKTYMTSHASSNTKDSTTFTTAAAIPLDTPSSGFLRVVDNTGRTEQRYSYTSYSGSVFSGIVKTFGALDAGLSKTYNSGDTAYVPYIDKQAVSSSESTSVQYVTDRTVAARVRLQGKIPYNIIGTLTSTGFPVSAVLPADPNV
ncbi:MAG: hypothetical protein Q8P29_01240 [Candidatus Levybacteria bacterium]|nr:hypothetical protein [Candidatus Levybacteria bacterium]